MLGLPGIAGAALPSPTSVAVGATAAKSCKKFIHNVALKVGMKNSNLVVEAARERLHG